jgi:hypothetical protein
LNKFREPNFFISNVLVPLIVLTIYSISYGYLLSSVWFLPNGVNYVFVSRSWKYFLLLAVSSSLIFFVFLKLKKGEKLAFKISVEKLAISDFLLLLLPMTPVVQYILNNQDILSPLESLYVFFFFLLFSGLYIFAIPALLGFVGSTRILMILGLTFVFTLTSMASLSHVFAWFETGNLKIQWMFFGGFFTVTWILYNLNSKILHILIAVVFVVNSTSQLLTQGDGSSRAALPISENRMLSLIEGRIPTATPNIYLLVYDAYVSNETMLAYGIDNSSQEEYLREVGFELYPHTYSVAATSTTTMNRVLNVSTQDDARGVSGDGIVQNALKSIGYETYGIFPSNFFFREIPPTYDFSLPERSSSSHVLLDAILMGEFRFDVGFSNEPGEQFIETKQSIFEGISVDPVFIYTHSYLPLHSQNSGVCLPDETDRFMERLTSANLEMRQDIKTIIENDPEAIVIVAGDHGPYLTKNCHFTEEDYELSEISRLDIQDRYGTFLAIRWPTEDFAKYDDITVLQDLFPAVFGYLYDDQRILESKIGSSTLGSHVISGAAVHNGIIYGGINDGEPLFLTDSSFGDSSRGNEIK